MSIGKAANACHRNAKQGTQKNASEIGGAWLPIFRKCPPARAADYWVNSHIASDRVSAPRHVGCPGSQGNVGGNILGIFRGWQHSKTSGQNFQASYTPGVRASSDGNGDALNKGILGAWQCKKTFRQNFHAPCRPGVQASRVLVPTEGPHGRLGAGNRLWGPFGYH